MSERTQQQTGTLPASVPLPRRLARWVIRGLAGVFLLAIVLLVSLSVVLSTHSGSHWLLAQAASLANSDTLTFEYADADGTFLRGLDMHGVNVRLGDNHIRIEQLHSRWNPMTLLDGEFHLESLRIAGLQVNWTSPPAPEPEPDAEPLVLEDLLDSLLPLPVALRLSNTRLDGAFLQLDETELALNALAFNASLIGRQLDFQLLTFDAFSVVARGRLGMELQRPYPLELEIGWRYNEILLDGTSPPGGHLLADGTLDQLSLRHEMAGLSNLVSSGDITLGLAALLNNDSNELDPQLDLEHVLTAQSVPGMEGYLIEHLQLHTRGGVDDLQISANASVAASVTETIELAAEVRLDALLSGSQIRVNELAVLPEHGSLTIDGSADWSNGLLVELDYHLQDSNPGAYAAELLGSLDIGALASSGSLQLAQGDDTTSLAFVMQSLQASVNGYELDGRANVQYDGLSWTVADLQLSTGENSVALDASLNPDESLSASLVIDAPRLGILYPDLEGQLEGTASISGSMSDPVIELDINGAQLALGDIVLPELLMTGQNRAGMNEIEVTARNLSVPAGESAETIEQIHLRLRGQPDAHSILLRVESSLANLRINADGSFAGGWEGRLLGSELDSPFGLWQQTQSAALSLAADRISLSEVCWQMDRTPLCLRADLSDAEQLDAHISLDNYPLSALNRSASEDALRRQLDVSFNSASPRSADVRLPFTLPEDLVLQGGVSLQASVTGPISDVQALTANATVSSPGGRLFIRTDSSENPADLNDGEVPELTFNQLVWPVFDVTAEQQMGVVEVTSALEFHQETADDAAVLMQGSATTQLRMDANGMLDGTVNIDVDDLAWVEAFVPQVSAVSGALSGRLTVQGNLESPVLGSDIALSDGSLDVPALALSLRQLEVSVNSDNSDHFVLAGQVESGSGSMSFSSDLYDPLSDARRMELRIAGENFTLANLPDLQIAISPDIQVEASQDSINVGGQLFIPLVDARITELPESATDVSRDVVVIRQPVAEPEVRNAAQAEISPFGDIPLTADLRVSLGDDVRVSGFGLSTRLRGQLDINQRPGSPPLTYGELEVADGSFQIYGRVLIIEQGRLIFLGAIDNPALDIRAVREVENMRVGMQMSGTVRNIRSSLFSTPSLSDGDILSVIITGRPIAEIGTQQDGNALVSAITSLGISQGRGITNQIQNQLGLDTFEIDSRGDVNDSSLMLGKYITPRIFLRYAVGLFETENSLAIDYTVTDRIKVEAMSGQTQSIDLTYTLER